MKIEKIVYVGRSGVEPYDAGNPGHRLRSKKFLVRKDGVLILGSGLGASDISHVNLAKDYTLFTGEAFTSDDLLVGAGNIESGVITSWMSTGFRVWTPEELQTSILEALGLPERT